MLLFAAIFGNNNEIYMRWNYVYKIIRYTRSCCCIWGSSLCHINSTHLPTASHPQFHQRSCQLSWHRKSLSMLMSVQEFSLSSPIHVLIPSFTCFIFKKDRSPLQLVTVTTWYVRSSISVFENVSFRSLSMKSL